MADTGGEFDPLDRRLAARALSRLRRRLLQTTLPAATGRGHARLLRLAASEAEALAWQAGFPLLLLPVLLEEKLETVHRYAARQISLH
jgi:hypothetical protein